jgi:prepilin-type N-terminal cleavage/methylation domain-containing protein
MIVNFYNLKSINSKRNGFTLIELAVVLIIIGFVIAGVFIGKQLIEAARLRSVITDIQKYNAAALTFKSKYDCISGDCSNATKFFGSYTSCGAYDGVDNLGNTTCNGNGDGKVNFNIWSGPNYWRYDETTLFWQQLYLAGLIESRYTGAVNWGQYLTPGENVPKSSIEGGCFSVHYSEEDWWNSPYSYPVTPMISNFFALGNSRAYWGTGVGTILCGENLQSFKASSAYNIDSKIDDGQPFTGSVQVPIERYGPMWNDYDHTGGCTNSYAGSTYPYNSNPALYVISRDDSTCQLYVKGEF